LQGREIQACIGRPGIA